MRILHVIPAFAPARAYGGAAEATSVLCRTLGAQGHRVRVLTTDADGPRRLPVDDGRECTFAPNVSVEYCRRTIGDAVSAHLLRLLPQRIRWADVVHLTAVYSFPTIPTLRLVALAGKPLVWSPMGAFQSWAGGTRHQTAKRMWDMVCRVLRPARLVLYVSSERERQASVARVPHVDAVVIPPGVEIPDAAPTKRNQGTFHILFLGRLHPQKGIDRLLRACAVFASRMPLPWSLTIAGNGHPAYTASLHSLTAQLGLTRHVTFSGDVRGEDKREHLARADVVVVPSHTESFGMVIAEALAAGTPVIASRGTPWEQLEDAGCGLYTENSPESLARALERITKMPRAEMGARGRAWMRASFSWTATARETAVVYEKLLEETHAASDVGTRLAGASLPKMSPSLTMAWRATRSDGRVNHAPVPSRTSRGQT